MAKPKGIQERKTHSMRVNPDLIKRLKHIAIDEDKDIGDLVEEGIEFVIAKREKHKK